MPITTTSKINELLQVSGYDTLIDTLIPMVQNLIVTKVNSFANPLVYMQSSSLTFSVADKTITDSDSLFLENKFVAGLDIGVSGSYYNDGCYTIASGGAAAGTLTLTTAPSIDEAADRYILIQAIQFPTDIQMAAADFIAKKIDAKGRLVKSYSLGDYSETGITEAEILQVFAPWRDIMVGR